MSYKIAAVTVLYQPAPDVFQNILSYSKDVQLLVIVDNSPIPDKALHLQLKGLGHVNIIPFLDNKGIAAALNAGIQLAISKGFSSVLTMDQDSSFEPGIAAAYFAQYAALTHPDSIAVVGPNHEDVTSPKTTETCLSVDTVITSGSILNTSIFTKLGKYNEDLFIDEVDHEYCYRAIVAGYQILQMPNILLNHNLGTTLFVSNASGKKTLKRNVHSGIRLYYMVRNTAFIHKQYKKVFPAQMKLKRYDLMIRIKNKLLYNGNRLSTLKYIWLGYYHFLTNRFGKL